MRLITKLRITAMTTLVVLVYLAGKIREGEASYVFEDSNFVVTVQWLNDKYYRVYLNQRNNPTNTNYFEAERNSSLVGPLLSYGKNKESLYFHDEFHYVKKINMPNYKTFYITGDTRSVPKGDNITVLHWSEGDSLATENTCVRWCFDNGDSYLKARLKSKKYSNYYGEKPELILFDRHDKTSE